MGRRLYRSLVGQASVRSSGEIPSLRNLDELRAPRDGFDDPNFSIRQQQFRKTELEAQNLELQNRKLRSERSNEMKKVAGKAAVGAAGVAIPYVLYKDFRDQIVDFGEGLNDIGAGILDGATTVRTFAQCVSGTSENEKECTESYKSILIPLGLVLALYVVFRNASS